MGDIALEPIKTVPTVPLAAFPILPGARLRNVPRALQAESKRELDALMPSILDKAFTGEL